MKFRFMKNVSHANHFEQLLQSRFQANEIEFRDSLTWTAGKCIRKIFYATQQQMEYGVVCFFRAMSDEKEEAQGFRKYFTPVISGDKNIRYVQYRIRIYSTLCW